MKLNDVGPAIIVAAVVLGPGSILVSSKVGAEFGFMAIPILICACVLMLGMVTMSARIGVVYDRTPGEELTARLGRIPSFLVGLALFGIVAIFQSTNNMAIIAGLEPVLSGMQWFNRAEIKLGLLVGVNAIVLIALYASRDLYKQVEKLMKLLILIMMAAFLLNFCFVLFSPPGNESAVELTPSKDSNPDYLLLIGLIGTTFSVAGAYYQAYLVREKDWSRENLSQGVFDSAVGVAVLCLMTGVIICTSVLMFYGRPEGVELSNVGALALQLEPVFGKSAVWIFSAGILAGGFSSFLINAIIGGTIFSDSLGLGSKLSQAWPKHFTAIALLIGLVFGGSSILSKGSTVHLITFAQALTVVGIPAIALAILYLGTRPELSPTTSPPKWMKLLVAIGTVLAFALAINTIYKVNQKLNPRPATAIFRGPEKPINNLAVTHPNQLKKEVGNTRPIADWPFYRQSECPLPFSQTATQLHMS